MTDRQPNNGNRNNHPHGRPASMPFEYSVYGQRKRPQGEPPATGEERFLAWNYQFQAAAIDPAVNQIDFAARAFSPTVKPWAQPDPLAYVEGMDAW